ncbi:MAG: isoleucine--tRNA ligase [Selenomonadales bacterium]|jgi:isoleucyl-tRNA synthetase|nr:isoleucine--tRNA ligase [Selenomonadales bacterium]
MFKKVPSKVDFPAMEESILEFWRQEKVFEKTQARREDSPRYVFYEGPPTANGLPHIGHAMARSMKDLIPRYKTMDGYLVRRKAGWDTHGLPVELEVEKELGIKGKPDIEAYGVTAFIEACRASVFKYEQEWQKLTERLGFWLDMDNPYVTYKNEYIESVWWSLRQAWDKGLLYQGFKVLPYCSRCGTSLSSHEVAQGYEEVEDPSVFVRFPLADVAGRSFLVWTTTPWTLPSNVMLVVGADIEYVLVKHRGEELILAKNCLAVLQGEYEVVETFSGKELVGTKYRPPYALPSLKGYEVHYVVAGDFVTTTDGTGIVHAAPAFGEDDSRLASQLNLPTVNPVDASGRFTGDVGEWQGLFVKDADPHIIKYLEEQGLLYDAGRCTHNYPFCWRCDTPLLYYARSSWFIRMTALKEQMLANNNTINWFPEHLRAGRFGNFLENIVDWAISRERYWGTPLPIWRCECGYDHCVGSLEELRSLALNLPDELDLHRPYIDDVLLSCAKCGGQMKRVGEVLDCWYDSGSMPFAQWHYPFENQTLFEESFPADYICEGIDQTRGWFYTLLAISTFTFGRSPYLNVVSTEMGLDEHGKKMSKSRGNRFDPWDAFKVVGADGLRWFIYTVNPPWYTKRFSMEAMQEHQRRVLGTLWNVYSFFVLYANIDGFDPKDADIPAYERPLIDRWLLAKLNNTIKEVRAGLDVFNSMTATRAIDEFVDELSNWYVRRNRRRFWKGAMDADKAAAYLTLYETLVTLTKLMAPFTPFVSEELYQNLVVTVDHEAPASVHMQSYPVADETMIDAVLVAEMSLARDIVSLGRAVRSHANVKVRQPVGKLYFVKPGVAPLRGEILALVQDELNVKAVSAAEDTTRFVTYSVKPNFRLLGPRFGQNVQRLAKLLAGVDQVVLAEAVTQGRPLEVLLDGQPVRLEQTELDIRAQERAGFQAESLAGLTVIMDLTLTPELVEEGLVRELVSKLQAMRKDAGFEVDDKIVLSLSGDLNVTAAVDKWCAYVQDEVLATHITSEPLADAFTRMLEVNGHEVEASVKKQVTT